MEITMLPMVRLLQSFCGVGGLFGGKTDPKSVNLHNINQMN